MVFKNSIPLMLVFLGLHVSTYGFKVINQTATKKVLELQEASRPTPKNNETLSAPIP